MPLLTREHIQQNPTFEKAEVDVSEWGPPGERTTVFVREMSARERDHYEASLVTGKGKKTEVNLKDMRAKLAVYTCCDENGQLIFTQEDIQWLTARPVKVLDRICNAAKKINGLDDEDEEDTVKNSPTTESSSSGTN